MTEKEKQIVSDLASFIVKSNQELILAEINENYEQCGEIHSDIYQTIMHCSILIQRERKGKQNKEEIYEYFKSESERVYQELKSSLKY